MKFKAQILAATIAASFMFAGGVEACSDAAWTGGNTGSAVAGQPDTDSVKRYSGKCGMKPGSDNAASFVTDNNPAADSIYRARLYVYTGSPTGTVKFFSATANDGNAGAEVIKIDFDGSSFNFDIGGSTGSVPSIQTNKWYSIEFVHSVGNPAKVKVYGGGAADFNGIESAIVANGTGSSAGTIGSASFGVITPAAGSDTMSFDQFDSTRNATTPIGPLCLGDANGDGVRNSTDAALAIGERYGTGLATHQPDADESGFINSSDAAKIIAIRYGTAPTCPTTPAW